MEKENQICKCGHKEKEHRTYPVKHGKDGYARVVQVPLKNTKCNYTEMGDEGYRNCNCKKFKAREDGDL